MERKGKEEKRERHTYCTVLCSACGERQTDSSVYIPKDQGLGTRDQRPGRRPGTRDQRPETRDQGQGGRRAPRETFR